MYCLNSDIANQVSIGERKNNPLSSSSGSTISALTTNSVSTPTTKRCKYFTDDSLSANRSYCVRLFDHSFHLPVNCKLVTGNVRETTCRDVDAKTKCNLHYWLGVQSRSKVMKYETYNINLCINSSDYFILNQTL